MAVTVRAVGARAQPPANSIASPGVATPGSPTHVAGDLLVVVSACRSRTSVPSLTTNGSGWAAWTAFPKLSGTASGGQIAIWWKVAGSAAEPMPTVSWSSLTTGTTGDSFQAVCLSLIGAHLTAPSDVTPPAATDASAANPSIPTLTTATAGALVIGAAIKVSDTAQTGTIANSFTERNDSHTTFGTGNLLYVASREMASTGATGASTVTASNGTAAQCLSVAIAVKPPSPTATTVGEVGLANRAVPLTRTLHSLRLRARIASAGTVLLKAALYEGATNRSGDLTVGTLTTSLAAYEVAIPDVGAAAITNYNNLSVRFWAESAPGSAVSVEIARLRLVAPEAAAIPWPAAYPGQPTGPGFPIVRAASGFKRQPALEPVMRVFVYGAPPAATPVAGSDSASLSEAASVVATQPIAGSDSAAAADLGSVQAQTAAGTDSAAETETSSAAVAASRTDSAAASDGYSGLTAQIDRSGAGGAPVFGATVLDTFDRANSLLRGSTASGGDTWATTLINSATTTDLAIASNALEGNGQSAFMNTSHGPDVELWAEVAQVPGSGQYFFLAARITDQAAAWEGYAVIYIVGTGWQLRRYDNGSSSVLGATVASPTVAVGDSIGFSVVGSTLTAYHKPSGGSWTAVFTRSDATYSGAGKLGLELVSGSRIAQLGGGAPVSAPGGGDSATTTEAGSVLVTTLVAGSDSAAASDASTLAAAAAGTDAGTATDDATQLALAGSDSATSTEAGSASVTTSAVDSLVATDSASVNAGSAPVGLDSLAAVEDEAIAASAATADSASASDVRALEQQLVPRTDAATATDASSLGAGSTPTASDSGTATESASVAVSHARSDSSTATDQSALRVEWTRSDSAAATEGRSLAIASLTGDSATSSETALYSAALVRTDSATASELGLVGALALKVVSDSAIATDAGVAVEGIPPLFDLKGPLTLTLDPVVNSLSVAPVPHELGLDAKPSTLTIDGIPAKGLELDELAAKQLVLDAAAHGLGLDDAVKGLLVEDAPKNPRSLDLDA